MTVFWLSRTRSSMRNGGGSVSSRSRSSRVRVGASGNDIASSASSASISAFASAAETHIGEDPSPLLAAPSVATELDSSSNRNRETWPRRANRVFDTHGHLEVRRNLLAAVVAALLGALLGVYVGRSGAAPRNWPFLRSREKRSLPLRALNQSGRTVPRDPRNERRRPEAALTRRTIGACWKPRRAGRYRPRRRTTSAPEEEANRRGRRLI